MKKTSKTFLLKVVLCPLGNVVLGVGVAFIKSAGAGIDPFNGGCIDRKSTRLNSSH